MKVDRTKLKKSNSEPPGDCSWLIDKLKTCSDEELLSVLTKVETWSFGKCELFHWIDVLDRFDAILEEATKKDEDKWVLPCDLPDNSQTQEVVLWVLHFTTLLVEHSFSRHLYSSVEYLITLLSSTSMRLVLSVLNLLYMFSKRSNFITRLGPGQRQILLSRLLHLAEPWGGKENGFGLAQCCENLPLSSFPENATTLHYEFYSEKSTATGADGGSGGCNSTNSVVTIHIDSVQKVAKSSAQIMEELMREYRVPADKQMVLFTHLRLAQSFGVFEQRLKCVQARLQALSVLVYCNALQENANSILYSGLLDEFVEVLELTDPQLAEIKAATLRTLTSIIHLDRLPSFPKLSTIIDVTGASSYHGFLPVLVRSCISSLTSPGTLSPGLFPAHLATALFSFLYHMASYEAGGEALVACGMMEALLGVVQWRGTEPDHITFVTRAVRVIDLITNLDMHAYQSHGGLVTFIRRLEIEVDECRKEQPFVIETPVLVQVPDPVMIGDRLVEGPSGQVDIVRRQNENATEGAEGSEESSSSPMDTTETTSGEVVVNNGASTLGGVGEVTLLVAPPATRVGGVAVPDGGKPVVVCLPQRAALLKSMLNFLKKAIQDPGFSDSMRHLMEGSLPASLKHVISNAEYYGASLFLLATDVVTVYVFGEPSLLSSLQDNGLTDVVLNALLVKEVPATREVLGSLPNVFSALCLNTRGLQAFVACKPFERLFKVLLSPDYLPAMRRRRSGSDPMGDTASNLGNAMDELMRHQPSLKSQAMKAIVKLLEEVCLLGSDTHYVCWKTPPKHEVSPVPASRTNDTSSDEEDDEDEEREGGGGAAVTPSAPDRREEDLPPADAALGEKRPVPLVDYVLNVMKFVDAILSNNSTDDHCKEFVTQKGLVPLLGILGLPNLPVDFPVSQACQSVATVCKSILNLAHESGVLSRGLQCLYEKLESLAPLHQSIPAPGSSVLLRELAASPVPSEAANSPQATPLLHNLSAIHAYIMMLVHVCRTGQTEIRQVSVSQWGTELGLKVLAGLTQLYTSLVWESTVLLALCSDDALPAGCLFGREDVEKLLPPELKTENSGTNDVAMEFMSENDPNKSGTSFESAQTTVDGAAAPKQQSAAAQHQMKLIKPLLSSASRLGKALAELFGLLVKLCVGSPLRQRRGQQVAAPLAPPTAAARAVASALAHLLQSGLSWTPPPSCPVPKFRLTFLICSVRFTNPMLFDDKKMPYHLMLQYFMGSQGLDAFFETFEWAINGGGKLPSVTSVEELELPDGTGEFLDTWLFLLERLVNPRNMLDSPHALPAKSSQPGYQPFNQLKFLIYIHKMAFESVMKLWNKKTLKTLSVRISEYVLVILCSVLKGESLIRERLAKEKNPPAGGAAGGEPTSGPPVAGGSSLVGVGEALRSLEPEFNPLHLQSLMDMGFARDRCLEAITQTGSLEQATEYLLMNPIVALEQLPVAADMELSEEVQMLQAIAMSLGENVDEDAVTTESQPQPLLAAKVVQPLQVMMDSEPLNKEVLDEFMSTVLDGCLNQLDAQPQLVYKVCELLTTCVSHNGAGWRDTTLTMLMQQINIQAVELTVTASQVATAETVDLLCSSDLSAKFAARLHLVTLLFEEMRSGCARAMEKVGLIDMLSNLLSLTQVVMTSVNRDGLAATAAKENQEGGKELPVDKVGPKSPKWLSPSLLLLDLYEKLAVASKRRVEVLKICNHVWKWFDASTVKWCVYSAGNNKLIDDAYAAGEATVRILNGRRKYTVHFHSMVQVNEETSNRRPIMVSVDERVISERKKGLGTEPEEKSKVEGETEFATSEKMECEEGGETRKGDGEFLKDTVSDVGSVEGLNEMHCECMIRVCVGFMKLGVDPDTLDALMRLSLRLTRDWSHACLFASLGGVRTLLSLTESCAFVGFPGLAALLMRHVMEEPTTLRCTMEKVVRSSANNTTHVSGAKELHYLLRLLAPAACRDPKMFTDIAQQCLRIDINMAMKRNLLTTVSTDDNLMMKAIGGKGSATTATGTSTTYAVSSEPQQLIFDLLEALVHLDDAEPEIQTVTSAPGAALALAARPLEERVAGVLGVHRQLELSRSSSANDMVVQEAYEQSSLDTDSQRLPAAAADREEAQKKKPLLSKSTICKLLAEFVRSYGGCARLVTEHHYGGGTPDCSALGYMLDHLMVNAASGCERESCTHVRVLVAALASCNHAPDAQTILVTEVKLALSRATTLPESLEKHARIQVLVNLTCTMIEACPSHFTQPPNLSYKQQQISMNNMIRVMVRKGLVTDLARIPHSLDLSSPNMAATINAVLKPLESVSRAVNLPNFMPMSSGKKKSVPMMLNLHRGTETTNSEATRAQGDENAEDAENTEHDISGAGECLEPSEETHGNDDGVTMEGDEAGLEEIIDQILEDVPLGGNTNSRRGQDTLTATVTYVIDHDPPMDTDDTLHDSRMVTHSESQFMDDGGHDRTHDDDTSSESSEDHDEEDEGDEDNEDEDVEEEEEEEEDDGGDEDEEEDEEEGSVFDEAYEDLEEAFFRFPGGDPRQQVDAADDILLLPSYQHYLDTIDTIIFGDRFPQQHQQAASLGDDMPSAFATSTPNPNVASGSNAIPVHPLFQNPREIPVVPGARMANRPTRQRGVIRYHTVTPRSHTSTTNILQRLLGPSHRDVMHLTNLREATQVLFSNSADMRLLGPADTEDFLDMQDHAGSILNNNTGGTSSSLSNVPNALSRWTEETRVLEADSMYDAITVIKPTLMAVLEQFRDKEQAELDKKKKEQEAVKAADNASAVIPVTSTAFSLYNGDTEMREPVERSAVSGTSSQDAFTQDAVAMLSTTSIAESLVESVLIGVAAGSSSNATSSIPNSFSGLLNLLSPVTSAAGGPPMSLQEPPISPIICRPNLGVPGIVPSNPPSLMSPTDASTPVPSTPPFPLMPLPVDSDSSSSGSLLGSDADMSSSPAAPDAQGGTVGTSMAHDDAPMSVSPPDYAGHEASQPPPPVPTPPPMPRGSLQEGGSASVESTLPISAEDDDHLVAGSAEMMVSLEGAVGSVGSGTSTNAGLAPGDFVSILGDIEIPEGVDPSFLAALPEEMRQEVIAEQLRLQRVHQRATESNRENPSAAAVAEVNPEFLAALPLNIQEEVLAQQRLEQQRQVAARANPDDPIDPVSFLQTLPPTLRQTILADLEESQFAALPPELAQEAQTLRRQREERRATVHEHMFRSNTSLSSILRNTANLRNRLMHSSNWSSLNLRPTTSGHHLPPTSGVAKVRGRQLLDHEALTCLLVLLFVDEPKLNTSRLHRVLRFLCHHGPTRDWVIRALLSIIERCGESHPTSNSGRITELSPVGTPESFRGAIRKTSTPLHEPGTSSTTGSVWRSETRLPSVPSWLSVSMDAALGCRANIFQIQRGQTGKRSAPVPFVNAVHIHPQASPLVCRHALDTLISLAKCFPSHFLPNGKDDDTKTPSDTTTSKKSAATSTPAMASSTGAISKTSSRTTTSSSGTTPTVESTDFWELLVRLDSISVSRKGKGLPRTHSGGGTAGNSGGTDEDLRTPRVGVEHSPLGQLIHQLAHPVVRRSSLLTDRLLRLLALISLGLSESNLYQPGVSQMESTAENMLALGHLLTLAIQVLTSKSCSEEGLEDATALLLHLSHGPPPARDLVLRLLLQGATTLGATVATHISGLLQDLCAYNASHPMTTALDTDEQSSSSLVADKGKKGLLRDRFTNDQVVIAGSAKVKPPCELQLASMSSLTSKTSSQAFFLRTLKVIIQLREAVRMARAKKTSTVPQVMNPPTVEEPASDAEPRADAPVEPEPPTLLTVPVQDNQPQLSAAVATTTEQLSVAAATGQEEGAAGSSDGWEKGDGLSGEAMDVDNSDEITDSSDLGSLSPQLGLDALWSILSECLVELGETPDTHAVLVLQPAVEAFFLVHASPSVSEKRERGAAKHETKEAQLAHLHTEIAPLSPLPGETDVSGAKKEAGTEEVENDTCKFLKFAEKHRTVLNQILRQSTVHLADGPFSVLVDHTRLLDFDIKRKYFRTELERADDGLRREDLAIHVRREHVFEDSFRELHRRAHDDWKNRFYIVFEGEEGQDAGGLLREWYMIISREIFNPMYALFCISPGDRVTYMINSSSHCNSNHLSYFKFVGRVIAKAIYDNKLLECYFTRSFYKHILGKMVRVADMESEDYSFYQGLIYLMEHHVADLGYELTFSTEVQEFGVTEVRDLKTNGRNIPVLEENKMEYIRLVCQMKMTGAIRQQLNAFLEGFYDIIPKRLISIFNEQEMELLISGLPTIDIDDLRANTEYHKYQTNSLQIQWFWRALRSFDQAERAKFLQFVTGTSKVPLQGFSALEGMNGSQKFQIHRDDRSTDRLPSAHTCFNQLDLPVYETYDKLRHYLFKAIHECSEGFGFA